MNLHINEQDTILLTFVDAAGAPSQAPASVIPTWSLSDPNKATIKPAADGRSAVITPVPGSITPNSLPFDVVVTASATLPDGTLLRPASATLTFVSNIAMQIVLTPQPPVLAK